MRDLFRLANDIQSDALRDLLDPRTQEEGRPHGVRAVLIRPGNVDTQMQHGNHDVYPEN